MKKSAAALVMALVISLCSLCGVFSAVKTGSKKISFTEYAAFGDRGAFDNISLKMKIKSGEDIWQAETCPKGGTEALFYPGENDEICYPEVPEKLDVNIGELRKTAHSPVGLSGSSPLAEDINEFISKAFSEGESRDKDFYLKDYFDFMPLQMQFFSDDLFFFIDGILPDEMYIKQSEKKQEAGELFSDFSEYFRFPSDKDAFVRVSVRGENGTINIFTENCGYMHGFSSAEKNNMLYFCLSGETAEGDSLDFSEVKEGFGIYACPVKEGIPDFSQIKNICPIEKAPAIIRIADAPEAPYLYVFTLEEDGRYMNIFDTSTASFIQKIFIDKNGDTGDYTVGNGCTAVFTEDGFILFKLNENGLCTEVMRHSTENLPDSDRFIMREGREKDLRKYFSYIDSFSSIYLKDGILYSVSNIRDGGYFSPDYILAAFSEGRLISLCSYECSLTKYRRSEGFLLPLITEKTEIYSK